MTQAEICAFDMCFVQSRFIGKERDTESGNDYFGSGWPVLKLTTNDGCSILESFFDSRVGDHKPR